MLLMFVRPSELDSLYLFPLHTPPHYSLLSFMLQKAALTKEVTWLSCPNFSLCPANGE